MLASVSPVLCQICNSNGGFDAVSMLPGSHLGHWTEEF